MHPRFFVAMLLRMTRRGVVRMTRRRLLRMTKMTVYKRKIIKIICVNLWNLW